VKVVRIILPGRGASGQTLKLVQPNDRESESYRNMRKRDLLSRGVVLLGRRKSSSEQKSLEEIVLK